MKRVWGVRAVTMVAAVAVTAAVTAHAAPARPAGASAGSGTVDKTYSCRVRAERYIDLNTTVTLPPTQNHPRPANLNLFTVEKTFKENGFTFNLPQVIFQAAKNSLKIDRPTCRPSSRRVSLRPTGLPSRAQTVTPQYLGSLNERCVTAKRVLVHLRIAMSGGVPTSALLAVRNDNETRRPIELVDWKPRKIKGYFGRSCVASGN